MIIAYDGTSFWGWQKTPLGPTIEEALQQILERVLQHPIRLQAASRTDKGVHARYQVVNFMTPRKIIPQRLLASLNSLLPPAISVLSLEEAPLSFHPTLDAREKEYRYFLCCKEVQLPEHRLYSWHHFYPLDVERMRSALPHFLGKRDFAALCNVQKQRRENTVRTLYAIDIHEIEPKRFCISVRGDHFLFRMVRILVGLLTGIGRGKINGEEVPDILASRNRKRAGITAPPHGLFLERIFYLS